MNATLRRDRVLYADQDFESAALIRALLSDEGWEMSHAVDACSALALFRAQRHAIAILDWGLPGPASGLQLARDFRAFIPTTRILFCTALSPRDEPWSAMVDACDDFLAKPYQPQELLARARAAVMRLSRARENSNNLSYGPVEVDVLRQVARVAGSDITLQPLQLRLLVYLLQNSGRCVAQDELRAQVFRVAQSPGSTAIARQICVLRERLGAAGSLIATAPGGYGIGIARQAG